MRKVAIVGAGMTPFAEHFSLGIKDLLPMAFAECAASVDKGLEVGDIQAAWFGELSTTDGFPSGILADTCGLLEGGRRGGIGGWGGGWWVSGGWAWGGAGKGCGSRRPRTRSGSGRG